MTRRSVVLLAILSLMLAPLAAQEKAKRHGPVVRQADRILVESGDPGALFDFFTKTLKFYVFWPLEDHSTYSSGSVSAGDVTLEFYHYGGPGKGPARARYTELFLEPYPLEKALSELRIIGIPYDKPEIHTSKLPDGSEGAAWTTVNLPSLSHPSLPVGLFEYSRLFLNMEVRRKQAGNRLALADGGPAGITGIHAIVFESTDVRKDKAEWIRLLGAPKPNGYLDAVFGPVFRFVPGSKNGIQRIVFKVKSLERAKAFLKEKKLLGTVKKGEIYLRPSAVQGLNISFAEKLPE